MGIDKTKLAKLLAISEAIKGSKEQQKESGDKKGFSNEITLPKLIVTFAIFFFLLYLIINR